MCLSVEPTTRPSLDIQTSHDHCFSHTIQSEGRHAAPLPHRLYLMDSLPQNDHALVDRVAVIVAEIVIARLISSQSYCCFRHCYCLAVWI
ncbi:hypothetical protein Nepgr_022161 [Nepenthes gracilis]|uniref:Uncharacterized protein n=1 Tax=Nepenthes gracilis TaxID=150966 RepID=A0AAD3T037_NEPGR|nr:hypothetical protein Nepgr_022161 [Nepenthes gracilis]